MRILLIAPWFRTLAVAHAGALEALGHEVLVVTTDAHYASAEVPLPARSLVLPHTLRGAPLSAFRQARRDIARFAPHRTFLDDTWDARFAALHPRYELLVHDWAPHDDAHRTTPAKRAARRILRSRARRLVFFSHAGATAAGRPTAPVLPLTSESPVDATTAARSPSPRLLLLGRLEPYKQTAAVLDAWRSLSDDERGNGTLLLMGAGSAELPDPAPGLEIRPGRFSFADALRALGESWLNICYYRGGTQSGVQVLGHQAGTPALLSDEPGLVEYASPADRIVGRDGDLRAALVDSLRSGPPSTTTTGIVRKHYETCNGPDALARGWANLLVER